MEAAAATAGLDPDRCYRALVARDARFDGRFFVCVVSTGVYCRPICPARTPRREHCRFVPSAAAAEASGFRSCLRCRPETAPGTPAWSGTAAIVGRALRLIDEGALDSDRLAALAARLGLGERQLRRLFVEHLGVGPHAVAASRRLLAAKQLLSDTGLPLTQVAAAAGYRSLRRFNDAVRRAYGVAPGAIRRGGAPGTGGEIRLRLGYRPPLDWERLLGYLQARAIPGVEHVANGRYARTFALDDVRGVLSVAPAASGAALEASIVVLAAGRTSAPPIRRLVARLRRLCDLDAEPQAITAALASDPLLGPRLARAPGLRVAGAFDGFELAARAVLGQQITVRAATTLAGRLVIACGEPLATGSADLTHVFPTPARLATAGLAGLGLTAQRVATLQALAAAVAAGALDFSPRGSLEAVVERLVALPGIGDWTAHYIALRAVGEPDAFPAGDLGLRRAAGDGTPLSMRALRDLAQAWRPWRGYAAMTLWTV